MDLFQQLIPAGLHPQVGPGEARLAQLLQLLRAFGHGAPGAGVGGHLAQIGEGGVQGLQDLQQLLLAHDDGVPVAEEHLIHVLRAVIGPGHGDVLDDLLHGADVELLGFVHPAEGAFVVGAPHGALEQVAPPLSRGTVNLAFISHGKIPPCVQSVRRSPDGCVSSRPFRPFFAGA